MVADGCENRLADPGNARRRFGQVNSQAIQPKALALLVHGVGHSVGEENDHVAWLEWNQGRPVSGVPGYAQGQSSSIAADLFDQTRRRGG